MLAPRSGPPATAWLRVHTEPGAASWAASRRAGWWRWLAACWPHRPQGAGRTHQPATPELLQLSLQAAGGERLLRLDSPSGAPTSVEMALVPGTYHLQVACGQQVRSYTVALAEGAQVDLPLRLAADTP